MEDREEGEGAWVGVSREAEGEVPTEEGVEDNLITINKHFLITIN